MSQTLTSEHLPKPLVAYERRLYRHRSDVARLAFNLVLLGFFMLVAWVAPTGLRSLTTEILALVDTLPRPVVQGFVGTIQLVAVATPIVVVGILIARRNFMLLLVLVVAVALATLPMIVIADWFHDTVPVEDLGYQRFDTWFVNREFPSSTYLAGITAMLVAIGPWLSKRWRRTGWVFLVFVVAGRILTATEVPIRIGMLLTLGAAAGSLALVAIGAPRRRVDTVTVTAALERTGLEVDDLESRDEHDGVPAFTGHTSDGTAYFVKVLGRDERDTDLLLQIWRSLSRRGLGDNTATGSATRMVEHEALGLGIFTVAGVSVPEPVAVTTTGDEAAVLVTSLVSGRALRDLAPDEVTDELLDTIWRQVAILQSRHLAHGKLKVEHIRVDGEHVTFVDLRRASFDARDEILGADVAELLASLSTLVGIERAVTSATRTLAREDLVRALPLVQPAVITSGTRKHFDDAKKDLGELRSRVAAAAGVEDVELAPVSRITVKGVVSLVGSFVLGYYLISLASDWSEIWEAFKTANEFYVIPIFILSMLGFFTGAMSLIGAVSTPLSFMRTTAVMFGQSFLNRFTPANAGGMAMRLRYLQLEGVETPVGAAAIGMTSAASGIAQGILIVVFFIWGGATDKFDDFEMPDVGNILILVLVIGAIASAVLFSSWGRRVIRPWAKGAVEKVKDNLVALGKDPSKLAMLIGGPILGKLCLIISFWMSTLAFGVDMSFPKAGALYMIANTVGSAVPSPGGVGGIEAALTAVLIGYGVDSATAAAIVLYFRVLTFWLPTVPGYGMLVFCQKKGYV